MPDYSLGKVYKIVCNVTGEIYVGSTTEKTLARRLTGHVSNFKRFNNGKKASFTSSFHIIKRGDYYIELLENCSCNNKDELTKKERAWYDVTDCINKCRPQVFEEEKVEERKEYAKTYRVENLDEMKSYRKNHYNENIEEYKEKAKLRKIDNYEHHKELARIYKKAHRERYNELDNCTVKGKKNIRHYVSVE
eukprot:gene15950-33578_t